MPIKRHYQVWIDVSDLGNMIIPRDGFLQAVETYADWTRRKIEGDSVQLFYVEPTNGDSAGMMTEVSDKADELIFFRAKNHPVVVPLSGGV